MYCRAESSSPHQRPSAHVIDWFREEFIEPQRFSFFRLLYAHCTEVNMLSTTPIHLRAGLLPLEATKCQGRRMGAGTDIVHVEVKCFDT